MMYKLIINLKTYEESFNENAMKIANICIDLEKEARDRNVELILCPHVLDVKELVKTGVKIYSQHIDEVKFGAHTGHIAPEELKRIGVRGTLISHSEDLEHFEHIKEKVEMARDLGLETCVCARDDEVAAQIAKLEPNFIAVEPAELIGGNVSISTANPDLIKRSLEAVEETALLVGAGVKNAEDVKKAVELGARGILVASGVVKADDIKAAILDLIKGFETD